MKKNSNRKHRKKSKRILPRISEEAYENLKHLFKEYNYEDSFDENPIEMLEYLLATSKKAVETSNLGGGLLRRVVRESFSPFYLEVHRREKAELLRKKVA